jgi:hypothetical protein
MEAICGGDEKYPVHLISPGWRGETLGESIETIVISTTNNTIHGWFNDSFSSIRTHPLGHIWVGISGAFYIVVSWENE